MSQVVTRFPPSPTGYMHIGRARTALFNYLFARKNGGKMIFRFEDTDKVRSKKEFEEAMIESLKWLGISWDNVVIEKQTERVEIYKKYLKKLVDEDKAYISKEKIEDGDRVGQENEIVRFRNPNKNIVFTDLIRGDISFDTTELEDFIIARNINEPLYHLAVVVDDHEMGVTHVIRGDDGISNTPRQILIQEGIGAQRPIYAHIPLILAADKSKLSGRYGAVSVTEYRTKGYLPEAMVNYLALLGWHPSDGREMFTTDELIKNFEIDRVQKSGAIFDENKLKWFNREYLKKLSDDNFIEGSRSFLPEWMAAKGDTMKRILPILRDKVSCFGEISNLFAAYGELHFVGQLSDYPSDMLLWKKTPDKAAAKANLIECAGLLKSLPADQLSSESVKMAIWPLTETKGRGEVLWPLRVSLTGQEKSPDPFVSAFVLGKDESLKRIEAGINKL